MSDQHRWLEARLARLCEALGYAATPEHGETFADVYVHGPRYCLEVQRGSTDFAARTKAREDKGAKVMWLLTEDATSQKANKALFTLPAVRLKVAARHDWGRRLIPWKNRSESAEARLVVWGSVAIRLGPTGEFVTSPMDAARFLREVFEGRRVWVPPRPRPSSGPGHRGVWALLSDIDAQRAASRVPWDQAHPLTPVRPAAHVSPSPTEESASGFGTASPELAPPEPLSDAAEPAEEPPPSAVEVEVLVAEPTASRSWWRRLLGWLTDD